MATSAITGAGLRDLKKLLLECARRGAAGAGAQPEPLPASCRDLPDSPAAGPFQRAIRGTGGVAGARVRGALDQLGEMVGAIYTDDLLDRIFSRFCIGK